jgi:hypothetical protein
MDLLGFFVWAKIGFAEGDGRYKLRPCIVLAQKKLGDQMVYLVAGKYSSSDKWGGDNEVTMTTDDAVAVGADKEGVVRMSRDRLSAVLAADIVRVMRHYSALPTLKRQAIQNAAKRIGIVI